MNTWKRLALTALSFAAVLTTVPSDIAAQNSRGGGSFGGSRSSGGSRSYSPPRSAPRQSPSGGGSFGGSRRSSPSRQSEPYQQRQYSAPRSPSSTPQAMPMSSQRNTFGGSRLSSAQEYTSRYGVPRRTERTAIPSNNGTNSYVIHRYGGMGDGFMMGYLMGTIPWYYSMPFHPAFYYSRPYTVVNPDGTTSVYPGTFQWGQLFFVLLLVAGAGYILYVWLKAKRRRVTTGGVDLSRSSFG
jgi:hypothetical protein